MSTRMAIEVDVGDGVDPVRVDPHEVAEWMIEDHNDTLIANGEHERLLTFVSAEWKE